MDLNDVKKDITNLRNKYIKEYDPTEYHFKVGDTAWILFEDKPIQVDIVDIADFKEYTGSKDAYVFYWIHFKNISKNKERWENFKFKFWLYFLSPLRIRQPKIPPEFGPGHAVLAGEVVYKTAQETLIDGYLFNLMYELDELSY